MILNYHVQPIQIKEPSVRLPMRYSEGLALAAINIPLTFLLLNKNMFWYLLDLNMNWSRF